MIITFITIIVLCLLSSCAGNKTDDYGYYNIIYPDERPSLLNGVDVTYDDEFTPQLDEYSIDTDFGNIINPGDIDHLSQEAKDKLVQNLFVVEESSSQEEFFYIYYTLKIQCFICKVLFFTTYI